MKNRTRNLIAISVAAVATLAILFVVILAVIRIEPLKDMLDCESYQIRYGQSMLTGNTDVTKKIESRKLVNQTYEDTGMDKLIDMCGFSVFKAWSQFKYDFSPRLTDHDSDSHTTISKNEIRGIFDGTAAELSGKFSFIFRFDENAKEKRVLDIKDSNGDDYSQTYDTAVIVLSDTGGWVGNVTMYVFEHAKVYGVLDNSQIGSSDIGYTAFYPVQLGLVTTETIDVLYDLFDIDPDAKDADTDDHDDDDGHDH